VVGDPIGGAVFALATEDTKGNPDSVKLDVAAIDEKVAAALGTSPNDILINDGPSVLLQRATAPGTFQPLAPLRANPL